MNYKEQSVSGTIQKWRRVNHISCKNEYGQVPSIEGNEVEMTIYPDGTVQDKVVTTLKANLDNPATVFDLLNPNDDSVIGTTTYQNIYILLYSLMRKLQIERDAAAEAAAEAPIEPPV